VTPEDGGLKGLTETLYGTLVLLAGLLIRELRSMRPKKEEDPEVDPSKIAAIEAALRIVDADVKELLRMHRDRYSHFATVEIGDDMAKITVKLQELIDEIRRGTHDAKG
jgi:hypothetical protein